MARRPGRTRRGGRPQRDGEGQEPLDGAGPDAEAAEEVAAAARRRPLDESEAGEESGPAAPMPRLDLGSVRVPVLPGTEVRIELDQERRPVAASVLHAGSAVQVLAFAAPRGEGIWEEIRGEIAESIRSSGGSVEEVEGPFGPELRARVPGENQPGHRVEQHLRFVGFDGPRWFVRGMFSGPAATNAQQARVLESVLTSVVVARGNDAMAPRDALPLRLPQDTPAGPSDSAAPPGLQLPQRGPEITETR